MAELMNVNGNFEIVSDSRDFQEIIRNNCGEDAAKYFADLVNDAKENEKYISYLEKENEQITDGYTNELRNACEELSAVLEKINHSQRINRKSLTDSLKNIYNEIWNNL